MVNEKDAVGANQPFLLRLTLLALIITLSAFASVALLGCGDKAGDEKTDGEKTTAKVPTSPTAAQQAECVNRLKKIGKAIKAYATGNRRNESPPTLQVLVDSKKLEPDDIVCPATGKAYVYIQHRMSVREDQVIACEIETAAKERVCLFGAGYVRKLGPEKFKKYLDTSRPKYGKVFAKAFRDAGGK